MFQIWHLLWGLLIVNSLARVMPCGSSSSSGPPPSNKPPKFNNCPDSGISKNALPGQTHARVTWPKLTASDEDRHTFTITKVSPRGNGDYFSGLVYGGTSVSYKVRDSESGVSYCNFQVTVNVIYCPSLPYLPHGQRKCTGAANNVYGSSCTTECNAGYKPSSPTPLKCLSSGKWNANFPSCRPVSCGNPGGVAGGFIHCVRGHEYPQVCSIRCHSGFSHSGLPFTTCQKEGSWSAIAPCYDSQPPRFPNGCPASKTIFSGPLEQPVHARWQEPRTLDNSGSVLPLVSVPAIGSFLAPGSHTVRITATDTAGNSASCYFVINVQSRTCPPIQTPYYGRVTCTRGYVEGSKCTVSCYPGYQVDGHANLTCTSTEVWDLPDPRCQAVSCPPLLPPNNGTFVCPQGYSYPAMCILSCHKGFDEVGSIITQCTDNAQWTTYGYCKDTTPPIFPNGCPDDINTVAAPLGQETRVPWTVPDVTDNSGQDIQPVSVIQPMSVFPPGVTQVKYTATDDTGNIRKCSFKITVTTLFCPVPDLEPANATLKAMAYDCPDGYVNGANCTLRCSHGFPFSGPDTITCTADTTSVSPKASWTWSSNNSEAPSCQYSSCPRLQPPRNGALQCVLGNFGYDCKMSCQDPYDVSAALISDHFYCPNSRGTWLPPRVLDCIEIQRPRGARIMGDLFYYANDCSQSSDLLKANFISRMSIDPIRKDACVNVASCIVDNVEVFCGTTRRKRDVRLDDESNSHRLHRRNVPSTSHYVLIDFTIHINFTGMDNLTRSEMFQTSEEVKNNITTIMSSLVVNGHFDEPGLVLNTANALSTPSLEADCPEGTLTKRRDSTFSCVGCSPGNFLLENKCQECPIGSYSGLDIATACTPCPDGWSTYNKASQNSSQCKEMCLPGNMSPNGFVPCKPCPLGQYQPHKGATSCEPCPINTWTQNSGVNTSDECVPADMELLNKSLSADIVGNWSSLTVTFMVRQPDNETQVTVAVLSKLDGSVLASYDVPDTTSELDSRSFRNVTVIVTSSGASPPSGNVNVLALNESLAVNSTALAITSDTENVRVTGLAAYGGNLNESEMASLATSCIANISDNNLLVLTTQLSTAYVPSSCGVPEECPDDHCGSHGVCQNVDGIQCVCHDGYQGLVCDVAPDPCYQITCLNGGTCVSSGNNYTCDCSQMHTGRHCEIEIVAGGWGEWSTWTSCGTECGLQRYRQRQCDNPTPSNGGLNCTGDNEEMKDCDSFVCFTGYGNWSSWSEWTGCTNSCNGGKKSRQRTCESNSTENTNPLCEGERSEMEACNTHPCPIDGGWGSWLEWSQCSVTCNSGTRSRQRLCDDPVPADGGTNCTGLAVDHGACSNDTCPACDIMPRPRGGIWRCDVMSLSPYFEVCNLKCVYPFMSIQPVHNYTCGENTSFLWDHQRDASQDVSVQLPTCSRSRVMTESRVVQHAVMNAECEANTASAVKTRLQKNIEESLDCQKLGICTVSVSTTCTSRRKRSSPSLRVTTTFKFDANGTDAMLNGNTSALDIFSQTLYGDNDTLHDSSILVNMYTVNISAGRTITADVNTIVHETIALCPPGFVISTFFCAECPPGSMESNGFCVLCPVGYYQDSHAATSCKPCPLGLGWDIVGATSASQCIFEMKLSTEYPESSTGSSGSDMPGLRIHILLGITLPLVFAVGVVLLVVLYKYLKRQATRERGASYSTSWISLREIAGSKRSPLIHPFPVTTVSTAPVSCRMPTNLPNKHGELYTDSIPIVLHDGKEKADVTA